MVKHWRTLVVKLRRLLRDRTIMGLLLLMLLGLFFRLGALFYALPYANVFADELPHVIAAFRLLEDKTVFASFPFYYLPPLMAYLITPIIGAIGALGILFGVFADVSALKGYVLLYREYFLSVPRAVSALFGVATIPVVFALAKKLFNAPIAWIAALFFTFDFWNIHEAQIGHIWTPMVFFILAALYSMYRAREDGSGRHYVLAAIFAGLGYGMGQVPVVLYLWYALSYAASERKNKKFFILGSAIFFFLSALFSVLNTETFLNHFSSSVQSIAGLFNYRIASLSYAPKIASFSFTENWQTILFSLLNNNPFLVLLGLAGFIALLWRWKLRYRTAIVVGFPALYLLFFSLVFYRFTYRYILPALPFFIIAAAYMIWTIAGRCSHFRKTVLGILIVVPLGYALLADSLYVLRLHAPFTVASGVEWLKDHIPSDARVISDTYITPNKDSIKFLQDKGGWIDTRKRYLLTLSEESYPRPSYFVIDSNLLDIRELSPEERAVDYLFVSHYNDGHRSEKYLELFPSRMLVASFYPKKQVENLPILLGGVEPSQILLKTLFSIDRLGPYVDIYTLQAQDK